MDQKQPTTNSIIITKCGTSDNETFLDSLYVWFVPGIITSLFILSCVMLIILIDNQVINFITYILMVMGAISIPYFMIYSRVNEIKQKCVNYGKEKIPEAIPVASAVSLDKKL